MTKGRVIAVFCVITACFMILMLRLIFIFTDDYYAEASSRQNVRTYTIETVRPDFIDINGKPLTSTEYSEKNLVIPSSKEAELYSSELEGDDKESFDKMCGRGTPFLAKLDDKASFDKISVKTRYREDSLLSHTIGYVDSNGGVSGLEKALDSYLTDNSVKTVVSYSVNANGNVSAGSNYSIRSDGESNSEVRLTVDRDIQLIIERIADDALSKGAIVVSSVSDSSIKAIVSRPDFDPNDIVSSLNDDNCSFINRALTGYNVGSVYKPVIAAAAIESGLSDFTFECTGSIEIDGIIYRCNNGKAHGKMNIEAAIQESCNCFFIALGQKINAEKIRSTASLLGFGKTSELCTNYGDDGGFLPSTKELAQTGELCNHCFGQGMLLATPLQINAMTVCIVNKGVYRPLSLVLSIGDNTVSKPRETIALSSETCEKIMKCLEASVSYGIAANAQPSLTSAAGKTGTAETGRFSDDDKEILIGWFTGYFPADNPEYTVTVMTENAGYGYIAAAGIFKRIADAITAVKCS